MPSISSRTPFRQRCDRKRRPRAVGSDSERMCSLASSRCIFLTWYTRRVKERRRPLVRDCEKGEEEDPTILLMLGRDDLLLSAYLYSSAVPSDTDISIWRNCASLRVRFTEGISS